MLKQLLQQLLNTRTTPTQAAHNAAPGSGDIGINGTEYICPSDGYVTALANGAAAGGFNLTLKRNGLNVQGGPQTIQFAEWVQANMIPVAKGDKVNLELYNQNVWEWRFIPAIGGGYNCFVRRALSCLKPLSNFSRKVFSRAKGRGSVTSPTAGATLLRSRSLLARLLHTWHHRMASSLLQVPHVQPLTSLFKVLTCESTWHALKNKSLQVTSHCQKDSKLTSLFLEITSKATQRNSSLQSVQANLRAGGALC